MDTERLKNRLKRSDATPVLVVGLLVLVSGVALAATGGVAGDDFEDQAAENWTANSGTIDVVRESYNETYSLRVEEDEAFEYRGETYNGSSFKMNGTFLVNNHAEDIGLAPNDSEGPRLSVNTAQPNFVLTSNKTSTNFGSPQDNTWYRFVLKGNSTGAYVKVWPAGASEPSGWNATGAVSQAVDEKVFVEGGTSDANGTMYLDEFKSGSLSTFNDPVGGGGEVNESLEIDTRHYLNHNTTTPFRVYYTENNTTTINVTSNATVSVRDPEVLSVDQNAGSMTSTNNTSINQVTYVNASYAGANASKEVVVANETVENIDILPPLQKWTATIGDDNSLVIVIATAIAAGVAFIASSLAGVAAFPVIITGAWVAGYVATHTLLAAILMSIFVGLNVAQVVEFSGS